MITKDKAKIKKIYTFYHQKRRMPCYSEIMDLVGYRSKNAVARFVDRMMAANLVDKDEKGKLIPKKRLDTVPLIGLVEAGSPSIAPDATLDEINLEEFLIEKPQDTFMLEVKGDSMIEAHIAEGDYVIAKRQKTAKDGDIVIAEVDGEFTLKYFRKKQTKVWLQPANKNYQDIHPEQSLEVVALVTSVIRKV